MRVTFAQQFEDGLRNINTAASQLADAQRRVSSGRRLNVASDDPAGMTAAIDARGSLATTDAYQRATDAASSRLLVADTALNDIINQITAAKVTATNALGSGRSQTQLDALATEILGIRDAVLGDMNTRFGSTYLFAGADGGQPPFTEAAGVVSAYQGDATTQSIDIAEGREVQITFDGSAIMQGSDAAHLFDELTTLATSIQAGNGTGILAGIAAIDRAFDRTNFAQTRVGIALKALEDVQPHLDASHLSSLTRVSSIEDADMAKAITDLSRAETAQQSALGAFASMARLTLMDYLR
ncbi:MAG: flagellar hook-associated protein FlgL [Acidobacteria bacterium]|nr:flagellar hook-associated protein FlgL [Acidobacteriota bacterium]